MKPPRPYRRSPRILAAALGVAFVAAIGFGIYRYNRPLPALTVSYAAPATTSQPVTLPFTASGESAIATASNKQLGQGTNANKVVPTASIAKLITILTVLKKYPLAAGQSGPTITLGPSDVALYTMYNDEDGSTAVVMAGEQITEYQMLQAMLLPSANNIADSLATWAYGSMDAYRAAAQDEVNHLGMGSTKVGSDASGFQPDTVSTANDLVLLAEAAIKQPVIAEIAAQKSALIPVEGIIYNTNDDLGVSDITGLKTGTSDQAGDCFVFTAVHTFNNGQQETFVGSIMNSPTAQSRFTEATTLLNATYNAYQDVVIAKAGQSIGTVKSAWGQTTGIAPSSNVSRFIWSGDASTSSATVSLSGKSSLNKGQTIGSIKAGASSVPLQTTTAITGPSMWWRIFH